MEQSKSRINENNAQKKKILRVNPSVTSLTFIQAYLVFYMSNSTQMVVMVQKQITDVFCYCIILYYSKYGSNFLA